MFYKKILTVMLISFFVPGLTFGASSSSSSMACSTVYQCDQTLQRYLQNNSIEQTIEELIMDCDDLDKAYARLQYVLSDECKRSREVTDKMKNKLLYWAIEEADITFVELLVAHGADACALVDCGSTRQRVLLCQSLRMVLSSYDCEESSKKDIKKMIVLLQSKAVVGRVISRHEKRVIRKMHKIITQTFDKKGLAPFKDYIFDWRKIVQILGVSRDIRRLTYPLLLSHDTTHYQDSFRILQQRSPIEQFAVACDIHHFTWCIAYNLMYGKKKYDLSTYIHCGHTIAVRDEKDCKRCYKDAVKMYNHVKADVRDRIDDTKDLIELKKQRHPLSRRIAEVRASFSLPDLSSVTIEPVARTASLGLRRSPKLTQEMVRSMSFKYGLGEMSASFSSSD